MDKIAKLPEDSEEFVRFWEKQYRGWELVECEKSFNEQTGWYFYLTMRRAHIKTERRAEMTGEEQFKELYRRYIHREGRRGAFGMDGAGDGFFSPRQPARSITAYPGGLVEHSVNVFRELRKVVIDNEPTMEAVAICALLHDLCKANTYVREHHAGPGEVYSYVKKDRFPMGHGEKSVYLIARFMKLEDEEARLSAGTWARGTTLCAAGAVA